MSDKKKNDVQFIFSTEKITEISEKQRNGFILKRYENPWFNNEYGVRREHISFSMTDEEYSEYIRCKTDVQYFANKYCQIKLEDGSTGQLVLRDYQKDILDLYCNNRFSILMASRQIGKCIDMLATVNVMINDTFRIIPMFKLLHLIKKRKNLFDQLKYYMYLCAWHLAK